MLLHFLDVNVSPNEDTVWLSKEDISALFDRDRSVITKHINNIYKEGELDRESTCAKNAHVHLEGSRTITRIIEFYNLDVIISVGYRVSGKPVIQLTPVSKKKSERIGIAKKEMKDFDISLEDFNAIPIGNFDE